MKLLFISSGALPLPPVKGGAVEHLVDMFLKENEKSHSYDITVVSIFNEDAQIASKDYTNCKFHYIHSDDVLYKIDKLGRYVINRIPNLYIGNAYLKRLQSCVKDFDQYDIVIVENAPEYGLVLRSLVKGKLILHLHNDYINKDTKLGNSILACYDEVYTLSNFVNDRVAELSPSSKVKTLYNGVDLNRFSKDLYNNTGIRKKYGIEEDEIVVMYCGRLVPEKGVKELVEAFISLPKREKIKLMIVGSARYGSQISDKYLNSLQEISSLHEREVIFTGYIPYEKMPEMYAIADIGVVPSLCNDGFNLTVVEFMASGVPVIISDNGAMKELINEECGIVVPSNVDFVKELKQAINSLVEMDGNYGAMMNAAIAQSKLFSKEKYCQRFDYLLNNIEKGSARC
ncbi:glycosyltransferase family 4 protein [Priestia megaterium]|uniref:glycosyltransferase family 4 protein n=1 Tax=Priestia megaterium TaxID=1404 RepID=UPI00301D8C11